MGRLSSFREVLAGLPLKAYPAVRTRDVPHADASPSHALPARALGYGLELTPSEHRLFTIVAIFPVLIGEVKFQSENASRGVDALLRDISLVLSDCSAICPPFPARRRAKCCSRRLSPATELPIELRHVRAQRVDSLPGV